ncbi:MAG: hypothetical protein ACREBR_03775, partial [bacterium]
STPVASMISTTDAKMELGIETASSDIAEAASKANPSAQALRIRVQGDDIRTSNMSRASLIHGGPIYNLSIDGSHYILCYAIVMLHLTTRRKLFHSV